MPTPVCVPNTLGRQEDSQLLRICDVEDSATHLVAMLL